MEKDNFNLYHLRNYEFPGFVKKSTQENLLQWSMKDGMKLQAFSFDRPYKTYLMEDFVKDFFSSGEVTHNLERFTHQQFVPIGIPAESIRMQSLKCSLNTMSIFDRLSENNGIVRSGGRITKCMDYFHWIPETGETGDYIEVGNELRKLFLMPEESDFVDIFTQDEKDEFLFRIFGHMVIGGSVCQYEDLLLPYETITKLIYKDLVSVRLESQSESETPKVVSHVIQIFNACSENYGESTTPQNLLFDKPNVNNFLYLVIDPFQRIVKTFYHHV